MHSHVLTKIRAKAALRVTKFTLETTNAVMHLSHVTFDLSNCRELFPTLTTSEVLDLSVRIHVVSQVEIIVEAFPAKLTAARKHLWEVLLASVLR